MDLFTAPKHTIRRNLCDSFPVLTNTLMFSDNPLSADLLYNSYMRRQMVKWRSFGGFLLLNSSSIVDDYKSVLGQVESQVNQKICQARKVMHVRDTTKDPIMLIFFEPKSFGKGAITPLLVPLPQKESEIKTGDPERSL